jgi:hypothetical protein
MPGDKGCEGTEIEREREREREKTEGESGTGDWSGPWGQG